MNDRPRLIEACETFRLIRADATAEPIMVRLRYDTSDPFAIEFGFPPQPGADRVNVWATTRELVATSLDRSAGIGDVRMWPWNSPRGRFVALAISSPEGDALFEIPRQALVTFLSRTYRLVPRGYEADFLDVDAVDDVVAQWMAER